VQRVESQPAFVLHARPYRETSLLLEVLSAGLGRVGLIARGVRSARPRWSRGLLSPFAPIELAWQGRGDLATLTRAEPAGTPVALRGDALYAALYLNELLLRLLQRHDPHPELFLRYAAGLDDLAVAVSRAELAWVVRRFERDLLAVLGYGLLLEQEAESGAAVEPDRRYNYEPERGPQRDGRGGIDIEGAALLALARDQLPAAEHARAQRRLLRYVILHHLGGHEPKAWRLGKSLQSESVPELSTELRSSR
jgi:DNA repair protein RecO (recombination protein O)